MKIITLFLLIFFFWDVGNCQPKVDPFIIKRFRQIVNFVQTDKAKELAQLVKYPLKRENPLPDIRNSNDFVSRYKTLFDNSFKNLLKQYNDSVIFERHDAYGLVGGNFTGEIWIDEDGKISAINYSSAAEQKARQSLTERIKKGMHPTVNKWDENVLVGKSEKLLVRIDRTDKGLRYVSWSKGHTMKDLPDIVLYNGIEEPKGTMGGWTWTFKNGDWTYIVDDAEMCEDAKNCGLFLELLFKSELKSAIRLKEIK